MSVKVKSRIPEIASEMPHAVKVALEDGAHLIAQEAKQRAPDAPPYGEGLVEAIHVEEEPEGFYVVAGDSDVFYGHLVEHGTSHSAPRPFLIPSLVDQASEVVGLARSSVKRVVE